MQLASLRPHSFLVRYLTLFGGETFSKLCVMAAFAYLAHVLPPSDYGLVELALSITVFFVLGVESGMGLYGARVVAASPERIPRLVPAVMVLRAVFGLPAFVLILGVAWAYQSAGLGLLAVNGLAIFLTPFLTQWVFQGLRQMQWVAAGTAARNFTFVVFVLAFVRPGRDLRLVALAEVCGVAMLAAVSTFFLFLRLRVRLDWSDVVTGTRHLFRDVWFMGLSDFTWACLWYSPAIILGWTGLDRTEQVAWVASSVRIVLALHTFVFLYFFNLLPNLAKELTAGLAGWRDVIRRSIAISVWPACLLALGGTLIAPLLIPAIYGEVYEAAVRPFQIAIWMIPVAWFSGHFRFSLIAAGQQRWEFVVSAATAVVTVGFALFLATQHGSVGAASALLIGGVANLVLAVMACDRHVGPVAFWPLVRPVLLTTGGCLIVGIGVAVVAGSLAAATVACLLFVAVAVRQDNELVGLAKRLVKR